MKGNINLQDNFLNQARRNNLQVTIYLINGFQLRGLIKGFDNFTVILENNENQQQMVYKHAISTITPQKNIENLFDNQSKDKKEDKL